MSLILDAMPNLDPGLSGMPQQRAAQEAEPVSYSRALLEHYFDLREQAQQVDKMEGQELVAAQEQARAWAQENGLLDIPESPEDRFDYYTGFSERMARAKILGLVDFLEQNYPQISQVELDTTRAFIEATSANYKDQPEVGVASDADGSHAFVVPARMGRRHSDYGKEVELAIPAFRYLPNEIRAQMLIGLPPFVIDTYEPDEHGRRGYLVLAPVFGDMQEDLGSSIGLSSKAGIQNVNAAVDFVQRRFGVEVVGLGANLPAITNYGQKITNQEVITTTGHAGTVDLIRKIVGQTLRATMPGGHTEISPGSIGVLGLGAIGEAIARVMAAEYPDAKINVHDLKPALIARMQAQGPNFLAGIDQRSVIMDSDITISAIAGIKDKDRLHLEKMGISELGGRVIVDDSQPGSIDPTEAERLGGAVVWAIGSDTQGRVRRRGYDYATMADSHADLFGCEAEAASLALYKQDLCDRNMPKGAIDRIIRKIALRDRVTVQHVRYMSALFTKFGIRPSEPQAFGQRVAIPVRSAA